MYICLRKSENTQSIIVSLLAFGEEVNVDDLTSLIFIKMPTDYESTVSAYVTRVFHAEALKYYWALHLYKKGDTKNNLNIRIEEIETIFSL